MDKLARKPSTDPLQEKLRSDKASFNKEVSTFVNDLIHLKKTMNGWPSKFHMQKSKIIDPIPADPTTIIGALAGDFQDLAHKGTAIVEQQLNYSKNRRQKQPKQLNLPLGSAPTTPDLSKQLSLNMTAYEQKYGLVAEGSNTITRFFARLLNPAIGGSEAARIRKYRMSLLTTTVDTENDLKKLQSVIVGSSPESIFTASKILLKIENNWSFLRQGFFTYRASMPKAVKDSGGTITHPTTKHKDSPKEENVSPEPEVKSKKDIIVNPILIEAKNIITDFVDNAGNFLDLNVKPMNLLIRQFVAIDDDGKSQLAPQIISTYKELINEANNKYATSGTSLNEIWNNKNNKTASDLQIFAQNALSRWYGKIKHQLDPFDKTSSFRLEIYKISEENKKLIDKIMNSLEKEMNVEVLEPLINKVGELLFTTREIMRGLESTIKGKGFDRPFIDMLESGKITEHGTGMSESEKVHLKKMLETRRLRELSNMYRK